MDCYLNLRKSRLSLVKRPGKKGLAPQALSAFMVVVLLATDLAIPFAHAQTAETELEETYTSILERLSGGITALEANPSVALAREAVLPASLQGLRDLDAGLAADGRGADARTKALRNRYALYHHNRIVNALALADQVAAVSHDESLKDLVFSSVLDVIPDVNPDRGLAPRAASERISPDEEGRTDAGAFLLRSNHEGEVRDDDAGLVIQQIADQQTVAVTHRYDSYYPPSIRSNGQLRRALFKRAVILENEKALIRAYWLYQGRFVKNIPSSDAAAVAEVVDGLHVAADLAELRSAVVQVRAQLERDDREGTYRRGQFAANRRALLLRMKSQSRELKRLRRLAPPSLSSAAGGTVHEGSAWEAWVAMDLLRRLTGRWPVAPYTGRYSRMEQIIAQAEPYLFALSGHNITWGTSGLSSRPRSSVRGGDGGGAPPTIRCQSDGKVELDSRGHAPLRDVFALIYPGHQQELLNQYLSYLHRSRPPVAGSEDPSDGCVTSAAPHGFNRHKFFMDFIESIYSSRFGANASTPLGEIAPWELDGSAAYERHKLRLLAEEPLLNVDSIKESYELTWSMTVDLSGHALTPSQRDRYLTNRGYGLTARHVTKALNEQKDAIKSNAEELANLRMSTDHDDDLVTLLQRNPVAFWRLAAKDWRLIKPMCDAYERIRTNEAHARAMAPYYFAGFFAAAVAIVATGGIGLYVGGPVGAALILASTTAGFILGGYGLYASVSDAIAARTSYNVMVGQVLAGIGDNARSRREAERLCNEFYFHVGMAVVNGVFLVADLGAFMSSVRLLGQLRSARALLARTGPLGAYGGGTDVMYLGRSFSVLTRGERAAEVQLRAIHEVMEQNASRSLTEWGEDLARRSAQGRRAADYPHATEWAGYELRAAAESTAEAAARPTAAATARAAAAAARVEALLRTLHGGIPLSLPRLPTPTLRLARFYRMFGGGLGRGAGGDWVTRKATAMGFADLNRAGLPMVENPRQLQNFLDYALRDTIVAFYHDRSAMHAMRNAFRSATSRVFLDRDATLRRFFPYLRDALRRIERSPIEMAADFSRLDSLAQARNAAEHGAETALSAEFQSCLRAMADTSEGGFWGAVSRTVRRPGSRAVDPARAQAMAEDFRRFIMYFFGPAFGVGMLYSIAAPAAEPITRIEELTDSAGRNPFIPEGVNALIRRADSEAGPGVTVMGRYTQAQIDQLRGESDLYQAYVRRLAENRRRQAICRGESGPVPESCSTSTGRSERLAALEEDERANQAALRNMEDSARNGDPSYPNPTARYEALRREAGF